VCFVMHYYFLKGFFINFFFSFPFFLSSCVIVIDQPALISSAVRSWLNGRSCHERLETVRERAVVDSTEWSRLCRWYMCRFRQEFIYSGAGTRPQHLYRGSYLSIVSNGKINYSWSFRKYFVIFLNSNHLNLRELIFRGDFGDCQFGAARCHLCDITAICWFYDVIVLVCDILKTLLYKRLSFTFFKRISSEYLTRLPENYVLKANLQIYNFLSTALCFLFLVFACCLFIF